MEEPVLVLDTNVELVVVLDDKNVTEVRGVMLQRGELVMVTVTEADPQLLPVEVV